MDLTGKQVLVAGLGKSGIAAGALLKKMGCMVCLFDGNEKFDRSAWEKTYPVFSDCPLWIGELPDAAVQEMELAVVSPGIPLDTPVILKLQERRNLRTGLKKGALQRSRVQMVRQQRRHWWEKS